MHREAGPKPRAAAAAAPVAAAPAAVAGLGLRGCSAAPRGLRAGRRPGLERRGLPRLGHPHAAPGCAGGRRGGPGQLLRAAAVHTLAEPAAHWALSGTRWPLACPAWLCEPARWHQGLGGTALAALGFPRPLRMPGFLLVPPVLKWLSFSQGLRRGGFWELEVLCL